jgi:hypothetical protein
MELDQITPVFGTAQPPRGLTGMLRRMAYSFPEHRARRWMLLILTDRIEAYSTRLGLPDLVRPRLHGRPPAEARERYGSREVLGAVARRPAALGLVALGVGALALALSPRARHAAGRAASRAGDLVRRSGTTPGRRNASAGIAPGNRPWQAAGGRAALLASRRWSALPGV